MKLTKTKLKQMIQETLKEIDVLPSGRRADTRGGPHMSAEKFVDMFMAFAYMVESDQVRPDEFKGAIAKLTVSAKQAQANPTGEDF